MKAKFVAATLAACTMLGTQARKVHTIGDSTMATYNTDGSTTTRGWGQMFQQFFTAGVTVNNRAKSGSSSKSFYNDPAYWQSVKKQIEPGDYVLIQFAHNDEKNGGCDGDSLKAYYMAAGDTDKATALDTRGTLACGSYKDYLRKYVEETRELGATPVLVGAICRKYFSGSTIRRNGRHDLGDNFEKVEKGVYSSGNKVDESDHSRDYPYQMKLVAEEMGVDYLDLTAATKQLYESYGDTKCNDLLFDGNGSTHTSAMGATLIARLAAQLMQKAGILTESLHLTTDLSVSPEALSLGQAYKGQTMTRELMVSGFDLQPAEGTVSVTATDGLAISTDGASYGTSASMTYQGSTLIGSLQVRYTYKEAGAFSEAVTLTCGDKTLTVPVTGECIQLADGVATSAYWRLEKDDACTVTGLANPLGETYSEMKLQRYSNPNKATTWPEYTGYDASRKVQRNIIEGETWPAGEIDEVSTRYIEFAVQPAAGSTLNVDSIGLFVCGCGGNGMQCKIYYSKEADFANPVNIAELKTMKANNMMTVTAQPVLKLEEGETLRLRIYPWYNGAASGKTICVSDVMIHGVAVDNASTSVGTINHTASADSRIYTLQGVCRGTDASALPGGLYIIDGKKTIKK